MNMSIKSLQKTVKQLCTPAFIYLVMSAISFLILASQNIADSSRFCLGKLSCQIPHVSLVFLIKILYIAFWTWIINTLCKSGYKTLAWVVLFLPVIFFFVLAGLFIIMVTGEHVEQKLQDAAHKTQ